MALKPTIYKARINLSDLDREVYDALNLTVAQHPSESLERMLVRVIAFCIQAQPDLNFTKGLSETNEPDLWVKTLDERISLWCDVGEPSPERVKKASHQAKSVTVFSFNQKSDVWWQQNGSKIASLGPVVYQLNFDEITVLAQTVGRAIDWSVTITGQTAYIHTESQEVQVSWTQLT